MIQEVENQSKILGLNTAIGAARAGEHGKGFAVVSNEIKRMAAQSKQPSENIIQYLDKINAAINDNIESIKEISSTSDEQAESIQHLKQSIEVINEAAEQLKNLTT